MKKVICIILASVLIIGMIVAYFTFLVNRTFSIEDIFQGTFNELFSESDPDESDEPVEPVDDSTDSQEESKDIYTMEPYMFVAESATKTVDDEGEAVVIITYSFTNKTSESVSFFAATYINVFQKGIALSPVVYYSTAFDLESQWREIKDGATIRVQCAYLLNDNSSDVEVEVYGSDDLLKDNLLSKNTFTI